MQIGREIAIFTNIVFSSLFQVRTDVQYPGKKQFVSCEI